MIAVPELIARGLGIDESRVTRDLAYQSIPEWDSLRHVELLMTLETELGIHITDDLTLQLRSVEAIAAFVACQVNGDSALEFEPAVATPSDAVLRGLEGTFVDYSSITMIDANRGDLFYRGYSVRDLVKRSAFEETVWLLINGELPDASTLRAFDAQLRAYREIPDSVLALMPVLANAHPIEALRTAVSALGAIDANVGTDDESPSDALGVGLRLIARIPVLIAAHHAIRSGRAPLPSDSSLRHAANLLHMLVGSAATSSGTRSIEASLILHADHGSNASAFAARVAIGTRASMYAAITSAIATFAGRLHGGAGEHVLRMIDLVGAPARAAAYVDARFAEHEPVMGFGHRVYRTEDPRVHHLREIAHVLADEQGEFSDLHIVEAIVEAMKRYARYGIFPNVDLYAGVVYRLLGLPDDLAATVFIAGRIAGWVAQALEQKHDNVLIRPLLRYVGPAPRRFPR